MRFDSRRAQLFLLAAGAVLLPLSQVRWGVGLLAWAAPVPFLIFLHNTQGWRSRLFFIGTVCLAWTLATAKYITPPFPLFLILLNGVSYGLVNGLGYLVYDRIRRGLPSPLASLSFAAVLVVLEWLQFRFTPLASNGSAAYTQLDNLPFLQTASLFGILGVSFLMYWFSAVVAEGIRLRRVPSRQMAVVVFLVVICHVWGAFRIGSPKKGETVKVAAVGTDWDWFGESLPPQSVLDEIDNRLFERTTRAAEAGAKLVVWNEVSTLVTPESENAFVARASGISKKYGIHLVLSYLLQVTREPFKVKNQYKWLGPEGAVLDTYLKHKLVPGEPSVAGDGNAKVIKTDFGRVTGAICYDYDFPQVARERAIRGADLVFLPSSDMIGVDPFHTQISAVRAIEGGTSVVRSTRMGLSGGIDPLGRIRGWLSTNETDERILIIDLPARGVWTLYTAVGDIVAYVSLAFILFLIGWGGVRRKKQNK